MRKLPSLKALSSSCNTTSNPNKFYSVFVSNDDPDPQEDKISNKLKINEPESINDR